MRENESEGKRPSDKYECVSVVNCLTTNFPKTTCCTKSLIMHKPSHELIDILAQHQCWKTAKQLLGLTELDEALAVRILAVRPEFLPAVVHRTCGSCRLAQALREHLPGEKVPMVEVRDSQTGEIFDPCVK